MTEKLFTGTLNQNQNNKKKNHKMAHLEVVRILITIFNIIFEDCKFRQKSYFVELSTMSMDKIKSVMLRRTCWLDCIFI